MSGRGQGVRLGDKDDPTVPCTILMPLSLRSRVDRHVETLQPKTTRANWIRPLIERALPPVDSPAET